MQQEIGQVLTFLELTSQQGASARKTCAREESEQADEEGSNLGGCLWTGKAGWFSAERTLDLRPRNDPGPQKKTLAEGRVTVKPRAYAAE